jgi:hypothetical protein
MPLELIVGAAVGAAVVAEPTRKVLRKGLIYGVASLLTVYDKVAAVSRGVVDGARESMASAKAENENQEPGTVPANGTVPAAPAEPAPPAADRARTVERAPTS